MARLMYDPCLNCLHDCSDHADFPEAPCELCDCETLHLNVGDCTQSCYEYMHEYLHETVYSSVVIRNSDAAIEEDNNGQVVIYTGLKQEGDRLVPLTEEDLE